MGFGFEKPKFSENNAENRKNNNSILYTKTKRYYPVNNLLNKVKSKYRKLQYYFSRKSYQVFKIVIKLFC